MDQSEPTEEELSGLKVMRLGFQNIGPTISNLEPFTKLENLWLAGNCISEIVPESFASQRTTLLFLTLSRNKLTTICDLSQLTAL